jgi:hypothetical protein
VCIYSGIVLCLIIIIFIYSSVYLNIYHSDKFVDFFNTILGSFVSFLLAIIAGVYLFRSQEKEKDDKLRNDYMKILGSEFEDIKNVLNNSEKAIIEIQDMKLELLITSLKPLTIEKAALSGLFEPVDTENLFHLARKIRLYNVEVIFLLSGIISNNINLIKFAANNIENTKKGILENIEKIRKNLIESCYL